MKCLPDMSLAPEADTPVVEVVMSVICQSGQNEHSQSPIGSLEAGLNNKAVKFG